VTKRESLNGKPYSGNQNVRFYEQEYALLATLWRGSLLCKVSGVIAAIAVLPIVVSAASFTYYPLNSEPPFDWGTESNWYTNSSAYNILPSLSTNALPTSSDDVLIQTWGGVSPVSPVVIGKDQVVSINNLHIAAHKGNDKPRYGTGASLTVDGGMLNVLGKLVFAPHNFTYGTLALTNNATMSVGGDAELGENNFTTAGHCRMEIDETSSFSVGGAMTVG